MYPDIKTASDLKYAMLALNPDSQFFTRETMSHFGDTMKNFGVVKTKILSNRNDEGVILDAPIQTEVYELYRKRAVKYNQQDSHFFRVSNLKLVTPQ